MLVRVGQQFARERIKAHVSLLLGICEAQSSIKACDRALSYDLTSAERKHVMDTHHAVVRRGLARGAPYFQLRSVASQLPDEGAGAREPASCMPADRHTVDPRIFSGHHPSG
jgi:hypothetical protein